MDGLKMRIQPTPAHFDDTLADGPEITDLWGYNVHDGVQYDAMGDDGK